MDWSIEYSYYNIKNISLNNIVNFYAGLGSCLCLFILVIGCRYMYM